MSSARPERIGKACVVRFEVQVREDGHGRRGKGRGYSRCASERSIDGAPEQQHSIISTVVCCGEEAFPTTQASRHQQPRVQGRGEEVHISDGGHSDFVGHIILPIRET